MNYLLKRGYVVGAVDDVNIDSGGDNHEVVFATPVRIRRVGFIVTTAVADAAGSTQVTIRRRPVAGADANHVDMGTLVVTSGGVTRAAGSYVYKDCHIDDADGEIAEDGLVRHEAPSSNIVPAYPQGGVINGVQQQPYKSDPWIIPVGQSLELDVAEAADSGAGRFVVEYDELPLAAAYQPAGNPVFRDTSTDVSLNP